jgi:Sulfatase
VTGSALGLSRRWLTLAVALFILNASLTFRNIWPTPAFRWAGDLSIELGACLALVLLATTGRGVASARLVRLLTIVWVVLVFGRYADVTTPALLGRPINLVWDVRYAQDVTAMFVRAAPLWGVAIAVAAVVGLVSALYVVLRWAIRRVVGAGRPRDERIALGVVTAGIAALFVTTIIRPDEERLLRFATPVIVTYVRQAELLREVLSADPNALPPTPSMSSDLSRVADADVVLMFVESYGAVAWQRPDFVRRLAEPRRQLSEDIRATGRRVVSGYVESPTYGGSSWFAHISLLSGIEIRDPNANAVLMTQRRETMVGTFARRGFRTIALMPGLWDPWPEGSFYGFQDIYGGERLDYKGPEFGWWALPDQFTLARFDAVEVARQSRPPLFVFFPTVSTHTPFTPTPPYQSDWKRIVTAHPFDDAVVEEAFKQQPDWMDLSPSYGNAVAYAYQVLGGYLRQREGHDFVFIVLGDHQPPALVSGEGQPWDVPVHIIASRPPVLDRLAAHGFHEGLDPSGPRISKMHELLPALLDAFGDSGRP